MNRLILLIVTLSIIACGKSGGSDASPAGSGSPADSAPTDNGSTPSVPQVFALAGTYQISNQIIYTNGGNSYGMRATLPNGCSGVSVLNGFDISEDGASVQGEPVTYKLSNGAYTIHFTNISN